MDIKIELTKNPKPKPADETKLGFGHIFTDHMFVMDYDAGQGWHDARIVPYGPIELMPSAMVLHYGQEIFEGMKAYRTPSGDIQFFRPEENFKRMNVSAERLVIPQINEKDALEALHKLVEIDKDWVPHIEGASLYIRPLLIGTGAQVGVRPSNEYMFLIFVTPVGPYFKGGFAATPYVITRKYDRAAPLGTGIYKIGGNYAASLRANKMAHDAGYASEFYLDAKEKKYIDECGAANFFGIKDNTYVTPLSSSILPSITNRSLMQLAEDMGMKVERRPIPEEELATFEEAGACGTAAVISPIERIDDLENHKSYVIAKDGKPGAISEKLYNKLRAIQYGDEADPYGWVMIVE